MPDDRRLDLSSTRRATQLSQRGNASVRDPTGEDQVEVAEIGRQVQGKPMTRDPAGNAHANRRQLLRADPCACQSVDSSSHDAAVARDADQHLFEVAHIPVHVATIRFEIQNRIPDDLSRTVVRDITAAPRLVDFDTSRGKGLRRDENVRTPPISPNAKCQYRRVLDQKQQVVDLIGAPLLDERTLQSQRVDVGDNAKLTDFEESQACEGSQFSSACFNSDMN